MHDFECRINQTPFTAQFPADPTTVMHGAALCVYFAPQREDLTLDSTVSVKSTSTFEGTGTRTVRQVLEWVRTPEGQQSLDSELWDAFKRDLEALADRLLPKP